MSVDALTLADKNQARAADPSASAWVSANAGTGKTEVLVRRSLRLLLAGSRPEAILCLTYTKTAAAEMQNRLLKELAGWATLPADDLRAALLKLLGHNPDEDDLRAARRLFACVLEAKGGLKIHTIHGFCERLLQRFPLEAQITPHFTVLDERGAMELRRAAFDATVARATRQRDGVLGKALDRIIAVTTEDYFRKVVDAVLARRAELDRMIAYHACSDWTEAECLALKRLFGVTEHEEEVLIGELAAVLSDAEIDAALAAFAIHAAKGIDGNTEAALREAKTSRGEMRVALLRGAFSTTDHKTRAQICSKDFKANAPGIAQMLEEAKHRFAELDLRLAYLRAAEASGALLALADAVQGDYERRKRAEAALDYDDLIAKTGKLLSRAAAAAWVLFKIDGGIDHILVDEAQDTNPAQWAIIQSLADEFFAGAGASSTLRTLFAVGDEKQSIYSFQGADPAKFGAAGRSFRQKAASAALKWDDVPLNVSFRSTVPVLKAVDAVFNRDEARQGLSSEPGSVIEHYAARQGEAGLVELWELEEETPSEPADAFEPWNEAAGGARAVDQLCRRIASTIKGWLASGEPLQSEGRQVRAGDILILVRRRDPFTAPMFRALKRAGVAVAGADRMRLLDQLAVQDLLSLADVLLLPEDDLSLAVVLKSPLFGLDDAALFDLAHKRQRSLWGELEAKAREDQRFAEAATLLAAWRARADFQPPYEFYSEVLGQDGQRMRRRFLTRLGPEAAEAIDEFLDLALNFDREAAPSLQGFLNELRAGDVDIKRDMEQDRDEVRIMTVHGAKGLQAPIVFLPDTCMGPRPQNPRFYALRRLGVEPDEVGHLIWAPKRADLAALAEAKSDSKRAEAEEYHRLLYVAMTRARDRLYICGWHKKSPEKLCWYELIADGIGGLLGEQIDTPDGKVRRMVSEQTASAKHGTQSTAEASSQALPDWAMKPAPHEPSRRAIQPSRLAAHLAGETDPAAAEQPPLGPRELAENTRFLRGRLVHALLQYLPEVAPEDWLRATRAFVAARGGDLAETIKQEIVDETLAILNDPLFAELFGAESRAEVPIVCRIGVGEDAYELSGQIDRLAVLDDRLLVLDYKTNRPPPLTPEEAAPAYIAQLAAYRYALRRMFPGKTVNAALLWTDGPRLMQIPSNLLDEAEQRMLQKGSKP